MAQHASGHGHGSKDDPNSFSGWVQDYAALISGGIVAAFLIIWIINLF